MTFPTINASEIDAESPITTGLMNKYKDRDNDTKDNVENVATGHDHDGANSKKIAYADITGTPAAATSNIGSVQSFNPIEANSTFTKSSTRHIYLCRLPLGGGGDVKYMGTMINVLGANPTVIELGIYNDSLSRIGGIASISATAIGFYSAAMSADATLVSGTNYWLAFLCTDTGFSKWSAFTGSILASIIAVKRTNGTDYTALPATISASIAAVGVDEFPYIVASS